MAVGAQYPCERRFSGGYAGTPPPIGAGGKQRSLMMRPLRWEKAGQKRA